MRLPREDLHVLTGSYALDAVDGAERDDFERHLHRCASCEAEVRGLRETAARLAMAKAVRPPAGMRDRVLAATYRTRQLPPLPSRARAGRHLPGEPSGRDHPPAGERPGRARRTRVPRLAAAVAAVAVAAAVALGVTHVIIWHQPPAATASGAAITRVLTAPDARHEVMRTTAGGTVTVVVSASQRAAVVTTRGLASLPSSQVYQVWVMSPSGARSAGLLPGAGPASPVLASAVRPGDRIGITIEPAGGTSAPTTPPVVVLPVSA